MKTERYFALLVSSLSFYSKIEAFQCRQQIHSSALLTLPAAEPCQHVPTREPVILQSSFSSDRFHSRDIQEPPDDSNRIGPIEAWITKLTMMSFIASMCVALPVTILPVAVLRQTDLISKTQSEHWSLQTAEACARGLLFLMPFVNLTVTPCHDEDPQPSIWVSNHVSQIDTFLFLASDKKLRGPYKRPIKTVYWEGLDENPVTKLLFHMAGFIPVQMAANGSGVDNDYDRKSFKTMLKLVKQAFADGFDVFIMPEGQLNPNPQAGLLPVFPGAFSLAKLSHRPIRFVAVHGTHQLWHADDAVGMTVTARDVSMRSYPPARTFESKDDFITTFETMVGQYGSTGQDLPSNALDRWLGTNEL